MTILVLGGAGYIGSHTVYELIDNGEDVVIIDNLLTGHIEAVHPKARFYKGDIRNREFLDSVFEKENINSVIHFAASSLVGESMQLPLKYYDNNLCGTKTLLDAMVAHKIDKIVFSSTAAVYGEPESIPILEADKTEPTNTYGETKLAMERMFKWVGKAHGLSPNELILIASKTGIKNSIKINQDVKIYQCLLDLAKTVEFRVHSERKYWIQIAEGAVTINTIRFEAGDGIAITDENNLLQIQSEERKSNFLIFDLR